MAEQKIELKRIRDFSANINDTFVFIKQNLKPLVVSFLCIAGLFLLASAVFSGMYQSQFGNLFKQILGGTRQPTYSPFQMINDQYFLLILLTVLSMSAMQVCIIAYMKLYDAGNGQAPNVKEVWDVFKRYFIQVFIYSIPIYLLIVIGLLFCLAPGVYLGVVLTPFPIVLMIEERGFAGSFSRCFEIIKENFWNSLGLYIIVYLIYSFASGIISFALAAITGVLSYLTTKDISTTIGMATSVLTAFSFVFYIVFYVAVTLHYFTLAEKRDGTGILQRLDKLGDGGRDYNNIQEQY